MRSIRTVLSPKHRINLNSQQRIIVLSQLFYPESIGTGLVLTELSEALVRLGYDVEAVCGPPTHMNRKIKISRRLQHLGVYIQRVRSTRFSKIHSFGKFANQLTFTLSAFIYLFFHAKKRPILVVTEPPYLAAICTLLSYMRGNKFTYLIFDVYPDTAVKLGIIREQAWLTKFWNWWNLKILNSASNTIVIGRCMYDIILKKGESITSLPAKTHYVPLWSNTEKIYPLDRQANPYNIKWDLEGKFVVSYQGNMGRFHDVATIMEAIKEMKNNKHIHFLLIGDGYKKQWMMDYASEHNLTNCQFHSFVKQEELNQSLNCAHVGLVSLLEGQEGLSVPSKTFGILGAGIPVIAIMSPTSEIARIIQENDCGIVLAPGDAAALSASILSLFSDPEYRQRLGKNALATIRSNYNIEVAARKYASIITDD